ncbi:MAG TPA: zinc-ribbon and DUF3426 domain-containing protein [Usitatibacter sp.]|nr:zinc-ribbon and DUF3426 domain-containing protein [Usitatibacter sp.]
MLITTCTHCLARFRVTPQQLNLKQGQVRCGRCGKVFSGFEALERVPDDDTGSRLLAARNAAEARARASAAEPAPEGELPELEGLEAPPAPEDEARGPAATAHAAAPVAFEEVLEPAEPPPRASRAWSFGVALLLLVLGCQLAYAFRATLAQRYPPLRPWLESACGEIGCTVAWPHDERLLKLEESELLEVPGRPGEIALGARIRNLAAFAQQYPYLELTLTDATGQVAARRVLRPADYMGRALPKGEVFAAGAQVAIQLRLATPRIKPTGYELLLFYP